MDLDNIIKKMVTKPTKDQEIIYNFKSADMWINYDFEHIFELASEQEPPKKGCGGIDNRIRSTLYQHKENWYTTDYEGSLNRVKRRFDFFMNMMRSLDKEGPSNDLELAFNGYYGLDAYWVDRIINEDLSKIRNLVDVERLDDITKDKWDKVSWENKAQILKDLHLLRRTIEQDYSHLTRFPTTVYCRHEIKEIQEKYDFRRGILNVNTLVFLYFADFEMRMLFEIIGGVSDDLRGYLFNLDREHMMEKMLIAYKMHIDEAPIKEPDWP